MTQPYIVDFGNYFDRTKLTEAVEAIAAFPTPRKVHWRLEKMDTIPWYDTLFVAGIIRKLNPIAKTKIEKSMIVLPGPNWQYAMDALFKIASPMAPYEVFDQRLPGEQEGGGGVVVERQARSVPKPRGGMSA
jgi:hypothetical protein